MKRPALLALVVLPLCFVGLGSLGLIDPDEGRYAEIPREMLERADFVTPTLNGVLYFEKPPLLYWLVAGAFTVFGQTEWAARLVPALSALLAVFVGYRLGRRMFGERAGLIGAGILATNLLFAVLARALVIDMLFVALVELALALWWCGQRARGGRAVACDAGFWAALALAILAKGPVALVLVGGTIGLYTILCRRLASLVRPSLLLTAPLLAAIAAPWFVLMSARHPSFAHFYWYEQHVGRFLGSTAGSHEEGVFYLLGWLPLLFFPWSMFVPAALLDGPLPAPGERRSAAVFLLGGALFVLVFFSLSSGKVFTYVLPAFPLVALPLGAWFDRQLERGAGAWRLPLRVGVSMVAGGLALAAVLIAWRGPAQLGATEGRDRALVLGVAVLLGGSAVAVLVALARRNLLAVLGCVAGSIVLLVVAVVPVAGRLGGQHSVKDLVERIRPGLDAGAVLVTCSGYTPALCFYARRRVLVNGRFGELHFGLEQLPPDERARWFLDDHDAVARQLAVADPAYCAVDDHETALELLPLLSADVREIVWNDRCSILGNGAAVALTPPVGHLRP